MGEPCTRESAREARVVRAHPGAATSDDAARVRDHDAVAPSHEPHERLLRPRAPTPETRATRLAAHAGASVSSEDPLGAGAPVWAATHSTTAPRTTRRR